MKKIIRFLPISKTPLIGEIPMKGIYKTAKNKNRSIFTKIVIIIIFLSMDLLYSQESDDNHFDNQPKLSLTFYLAKTVGGPGNTIEDQMKNSGFDTRSYGLFSRETINHPHSRYYGLPWMIEAHYRITPLISFGFQISNSILRETIGYANPQGGFGEYLFLNYSAKTYTPVVLFYLTEYLILGIGPSYNTIVSYEMRVGNITNKVETNKIGILSHLNLKLQLSGLFSVNLLAQYRYNGSSSIGPFIRENTIGILTPTPTTVIVTFPETDINYNHVFIGLGIGIHL